MSKSTLGALNLAAGQSMARDQIALHTKRGKERSIRAELMVSEATGNASIRA